MSYKYKQLDSKTKKLVDFCLKELAGEITSNTQRLLFGEYQYDAYKTYGRGKQNGFVYLNIRRSDIPIWQTQTYKILITE